MSDIEDLKGQTIVKIIGAEVGSYRIELRLANGDNYVMYHRALCCESVEICQIDGDINDLLGSPLTMADESTNSEDSTGIEHLESFTWTFYKFATVKGYVTITWLGESNGNYSESVEFYKL